MSSHKKFLPLFLLALGYQAVGQETPVAEPVAFEPAGVTIVADATIGDGTVIFASEARSVGFMGASDESELMRLLHNESIRNEIELVDDQYQKMKEYNKRVQKEMKTVMQSLFKGGRINPEAAKTMQAKAMELGKRTKVELEGMLLPHQIKRLRQVAQQVRMKQVGTANAITVGSLADELELTDEQKKQLREKSAEIEKRLRAEIAKLRADAKQELFAVLTKQQREILNDHVGEHFEKEEPLRSERFRQMSMKAVEKAQKKLQKLEKSKAAKD